MLIELANHNDDLQRLLEKGYALRVDGPHLVVRDIPYLDSQMTLKVGAIVTTLEFIDKVRVKQHDHQIFFAGSTPHGLDGKPIANLGGGETKLMLNKADVVVERTFSNKPEGGFANFFDKIEHYVRIISGPAIARYRANPYTFCIDKDVIDNSVFKFRDTLTSRAEIEDLSSLLKNDIIAIIGLGGTGAYLLDFFIKTPVKEIRGFDGDFFHVHNAFRSPGRLAESELGTDKAGVYRQRYENFREGLTIERKYIDFSSKEELEGVTFAFVCVDKGSARAEIFDLLVDMKIPFIDVGMGLDRKQGPLAGTLRATYYSVEDAAKIRELNLAPLVDDPDNIYQRSVQISELNALNASFAIIRYKQLRGFFVDIDSPYHLLMTIENLHTLGLVKK